MVHHCIGSRDISSSKRSIAVYFPYFNAQILTLHFQPAASPCNITTIMTSLKGFPQFALLPTEIQTLILDFNADAPSIPQLDIVYISALRNSGFHGAYTDSSNLYAALFRSTRLLAASSFFSGRIESMKSLLWGCRLSRWCLLRAWKRYIEGIYEEREERFMNMGWNEAKAKMLVELDCKIKALA